MPMTQTTEEEFKNVTDFTNLCNKWYKELVSVEDNLLSKSDRIQSLQSCLNSETETLKRLNESVVFTQVEQNYIADLLNVLAKEQDDLEREMQKLEGMVNVPVVNTDDYEECSNMLEVIYAELKNAKDNVKNLVNKLNTNKGDCNVSDNTLPVCCTILDHYADALNLINKNIAEIQQKFDVLDEVCVQLCIPPGLFSSPL